ncbi:MAG: response regulator [Leptolyngbya sp. SIO4C1]|nr:response regulator [Leptolyngbya sp. SIO4C1]
MSELFSRKRPSKVSELIQSRDWSQTSLGEISTWSATLKIALGILLKADIPMLCIWGRDRILFYNDTCSSLLPADGPAVGQSLSHLRSEQSLSAAVESVFVTGQAAEAQPASIAGQSTKPAYTWSCSAISSDLEQVEGVLAIGVKAAEELARPSLDSAQTALEKSNAAFQAALRESEDRLRMAVEAAQLGTWDWNLITNELIWDSGCKAMFGLPAEAEVTIETFFTGLHPEDRDRVEQVIQAILEPGGENHYDIDYRTVGLQDGVERWISARGQAYFAADGTPQRFTGTVLDISDCKQIEQALIASEATAVAQAEELTALMKTIPAAIWIAYDPQCHQLMANQTAYELMGVEPDTVAAASLADGRYPLQFKQFKNGHEIPTQDLPMQKAIRTRQAVIDEIEFVFPDGSVRHIYGKAVPLYSPTGAVRGAIAGFVEITALKQSERAREQLLQRERRAREEAEQANRLKDQFLAVLSHELRSPLNPILGWSKLLQTRSFNTAKTAQALATIERNARLQAQLVDDLLDLARILRGKLHLNPAPVSLAFVIEAATETVRAAAAEKSIALQLGLDPELQVLGDAARLQQIVWNLLSNAIKFTPEKGQIDISLRRRHNQAEITVTDTGIGIRSDFLPYIFESFHQEDISTTRKHGGLGLGLAIVRQLVEAHDGTITARSPGECRGATFTVRLPQLNATFTHCPVKVSAKPALNLDGLCILAVDDSLDTQELLICLLKQYGANIMTAGSGAEALKILKDIRPDVLISDIGMPEMDGYSLIQQIRALSPEQGGQLPAIALTAYAQADDQRQALASGYQRHLTKPIDIEKLVQAIITLLQPSPPA